MSFKLDWHGDDIIRKIEEAANQGLQEAAEILLEEANKTVPHDTGALERSGKVSINPASLESAVSYGDRGPSRKYAVRAHEHPEWKFKKGRRGKWLELTMKEQADRLIQIIAKNINKRTS